MSNAFFKGKGNWSVSTPAFRILPIYRLPEMSVFERFVIEASEDNGYRPSSWLLPDPVIQVARLSCFLGSAIA